MLRFRRPLVAIFAMCLVAASSSCAHSDPPSTSSSSPSSGAPTGADSVDAAIETLSIAPAPDSGRVGMEAPPPSAVSTPAPGEPPIDPALVACHVDADCAAVRKNACCNHGELEAVAASQVAAYKASFTCKTKHFVCPQFLRLDTRVAKCDAPAGRCTLVAP